MRTEAWKCYERVLNNNHSKQNTIFMFVILQKFYICDLCANPKNEEKDTDKDKEGPKATTILWHLILFF